MIIKLNEMYEMLTEETTKMIMDKVSLDDKTYITLESIRQEIYKTIKELDNL